MPNRPPVVAACNWLAELGLRPTGPLWEVYWSVCEEGPDPANGRTEIFAPIE